MLPRNLRPMRLSRSQQPFDSDQHVFELKIDGFRALAHFQRGQGQLVSRNGNTFRRFAELAQRIASNLKVESAVIDGQISCVDGDGRPIFRDLLFGKGHCVFFAFDLLFLNGRDLRVLPLIERKRLLKMLLGRKRLPIRYLDHIAHDGRLLFEQIVRMDLEGMVCKRKDSPYKVTEKPSSYWIKVTNPLYHNIFYIQQERVPLSPFEAAH
jgi:bifunctional non-homologous end joining protein LigD